MIFISVVMFRKNQFVSAAEGKISDANQAIETIKTWQREGAKLIVIEGCFDILHYNHFRSMEFAKKTLSINNLNVKLIIRVFGEDLIKQRPEKDSRGPILSLNERMMNVSHIQHVDLVVVKDNFKYDWIKEYNPDFIV
jgi:D-beta-D-heptose 7-phosphate kinase / D-beta-D-heptose 1-phosphate adenosyltransferase